jgi:hypothetical protein
VRWATITKTPFWSSSDEGDLLGNARKAGLIDPPQQHKFTGDAKIHVGFRGMPRGVKTKTSMSGMFSSIRTTRGRAMPIADQEGWRDVQVLLASPLIVRLLSVAFQLLNLLCQLPPSQRDRNDGLGICHHDGIECTQVRIGEERPHSLCWW